MNERLPQVGRRRGCLQAVTGIVGLVVLSPLLLAIRLIRTWRRGSLLRVEWTGRPDPSAGAESRRRFDVMVDAPNAQVTRIRTRLTDTVVRIAERLRSSDDVYHMVHRRTELAETTVLPVGPQLQELGERFSLSLAQRTLEGRMVVWLTLPRTRTAAEILDPFDYDPEGDGEPERLLTSADVRWGMAATFATTGAAVVYRLRFYLPGSATGVERLLERLKD